MKHLLFLFFCFTLLNLSGQEGVLKLDLRKLAVRPQKFVTVEKQNGGLVAKFPSRTSGNTTPGFSFDLPEDCSPYSVFIVKAALADRIGNLHLLGRLAEYKYYNMDAIAARALELSDTL